MAADEGEDGPGASLRDRALGKAADEFGTEIAPLGREAGAVSARAVRLALRGLSHVISGAERVYDWIEASVMERLKDVPDEELASPSPRIALPAIQGAVFASEEQETPIREMFANLIAKDMTKRGKIDVHPSFVEIVKQLSTDDAKLLLYFSQNGPQVLGEIRVSNMKTGRGYKTIGRYVSISIGLDIEHTIRSVYSLARLGLIEINDKYPIRPEFDELEKSQLQRHDLQRFVEEGNPPKARHDGLHLTPIGRAFVKICLY